MILCLSMPVRQVRTLYVNNATLQAQVDFREAEVRRAQVDVQRAEQDLARRHSLAPQGAVSQEDLSHAQAQVAAAKGAA